MCIGMLKPAFDWLKSLESMQTTFFVNFSCNQPIFDSKYCVNSLLSLNNTCELCGIKSSTTSVNIVETFRANTLVNVQGIVVSTRTETFANGPKLINLFRELKMTLLPCHKKGSLVFFRRFVTLNLLRFGVLLRVNM